MAGWVKIYRDVQEHWIWKSNHRFKWWIDVLLTVNHTDTKILIRGQLIECKRGQSVMSLETWGKRWNVTKKTVKDFFELLQKDSMLVYENIQITTRITICNYDKYQCGVNGEETDSKRTVNGNETEALPKQEGIRMIKNEKNVIPPTFEMVLKYCKERDSSVDSKTFIDWNTAKGWKIGKDKMVDWQAAIRTWEQRDKKQELQEITPGHFGKPGFKNENAK